MNKRFKSIILICVLCTILVGCGSTSTSVPTDSAEDCCDSSDICIPDSYVSIGSVEDNGLSPVDNYYDTLFYDTRDYHVVTLTYHKVPSIDVDTYEATYSIYVSPIDLEVDGKVVYYDAENDCLTTESVQSN